MTCLERSAVGRRVSNLNMRTRQRVVRGRMGGGPVLTRCVRARDKGGSGEPRLLTTLTVYEGAGSVLVITGLSELSEGMTFASGLLRDSIRVIFYSFPRTGELVLRVVDDVTRCRTKLVNREAGRSLRTGGTENIRLNGSRGLVGGLRRTIRRDVAAGGTGTSGGPGGVETVTLLQSLSVRNGSLSRVAYLLGRRNFIASGKYGFRVARIGELLIETNLVS